MLQLWRRRKGKKVWGACKNIQLDLRGGCSCGIEILLSLRGGRQEGSWTGSKKGIKNARFSFALRAPLASCFEHFDIFSLCIYKACLSHYSPVMTPQAEAVPAKNHQGAHSRCASSSESPWKVKPGGAAAFQGLAGFTGGRSCSCLVSLCGLWPVGPARCCSGFPPTPSCCALCAPPGMISLLSSFWVTSIYPLRPSSNISLEKTPPCLGVCFCFVTKFICIIF